MEKELVKYFENGISIDKLRNGKFSVFTVKTQRFVIDTLEELTPQTFENAIIQLEESDKIQREAIALLQKQLEKDMFDGIAGQKSIFEYFKSIVELPQLNEIVVKSGNKVAVGDKYLMKTNNGKEYQVYVHSVNVNDKKNPDKNEIGFIMADSGRLETLTISQIKKTVKEFTFII
jgi:hypothetical protein